MTRTLYLFPILAVWALSSGAIATAPAGPNILVIVADDPGRADAGYHGAKTETPNVDRLAKEGVRPELYNLADDPYEKTNVAGHHAELVANLKRLLAGQQKLDAKEEVPFW